MPVVRFVCSACGAEFPPSMEHCSGCGKVERRPAASRSAAPARKSRAWRLGAAWMSVVVAVLGGILAVMSTLARGDFSGVVAGALVSVLFANIAAGAFLNRRGAFLAGVAASFFPSALFLVRVMEFTTFLLREEVSDRQRRGMKMDVAIFSGCFAFFGILLLVHFIAWLKHVPPGETKT